jgi:SAM-dependent methyltransferase
MHERYINRKLYFEEQEYTTGKYVIPYINQVKQITADHRILEIGCGEGGNLLAFVNMGCKVVGIDINAAQIQKAKEFYTTHPFADNTLFISSDVYKIEPESLPKFDFIIVRDVIEHIPYHDKFLLFIRQFLNENGYVFIAFPPWRMPFGGHQQVCNNSFLSKLPYFHLLPKFLYRAILKCGIENPSSIDGMLELKQTKMPIATYKKLLRKTGYKIDKETYYFINPNYEIKFKLKPRVLPKLLRIPFLCDFYTTAHYSLVSVR